MKYSIKKVTFNDTKTINTEDIVKNIEDVKLLVSKSISNGYSVSLQFYEGSLKLATIHFKFKDLNYAYTIMRANDE